MSSAPTPAGRPRASGRHQLTLPALGALLLAGVLIVLLVARHVFNGSSRPSGAGSGIAATQVRSVPPFTGVDLAGANNVTVQVGVRQSVIVHADSNLLSRVTTRVQMGRLVIGTTPGNLSAKTPMYVAVSVPTLAAVTLQGDGNITATAVNSRTLTVDLPGSGVIQATGATTRLDVTISGEGTALLDQTVTRDAKAVLSGDGSITLRATHSLDAIVSGSGTILYKGHPPQVTTAVTGNGAVTAG